MNLERGLHKKNKIIMSDECVINNQDHKCGIDK